MFYLLASYIEKYAFNPLPIRVMAHITFIFHDLSTYDIYEKPKISVSEDIVKERISIITQDEDVT